jgi:long-chain acyl-CoA synthetase
MQRIELLVALEKELDASVDESRISEIYTVRDLVDTVREGVSADRGRGLGSQAGFAGWKAVFSEEISDPDVLELRRPRSIGTAIWYVAFKLLQMFASDRFDLRISGLERLPASGPFILSPNHQSYLDPFIVACVLPWPVFRRLFAVGTSDIFGSRLMRHVARRLRVLVVDPDANLVSAMRGGAFGLRQDGVLMLFPEGERSIDGTPRIFKKGAAILSANLQVPIVPVAIEGFYEVWPRGKHFFQRFNRLRMSFGHPIYPPRMPDPTDAEYVQLTAELKSSVVEMWNILRHQPQ